MTKEVNRQSLDEQKYDKQLKSYAIDLLPKYGDRWDNHSVVTMRRQTLSRILYYQELYTKILEIPGVICEFGVQWGETLTTLINLRGIYEPYNISRKIIGFDSFKGFLEKEGSFEVGDYSTIMGYEKILEEILTIQESFCPISHLTKFELIKGDVTITIPQWLMTNKHAIISMAIFDMDLYKPTKNALSMIIPRLTKGSLIVFDEFCHPLFPGETKAVQEIFGSDKIALRRSPLQPYCSWMVWE